MSAPKNIGKENKPKPSLVPMDLLIKVLEPGYKEGLIKYYRESWRLGFKTSDMYDGAIRHLIAYFYDQEDFDPDAEKLGIKKLHLGGALFCILCMADTLLNHPELDDRGKDYNPELLKNKLFHNPNDATDALKYAMAGTDKYKHVEADIDGVSVVTDDLRVFLKKLSDNRKVSKCKSEMQESIFKVAKQYGFKVSGKIKLRKIK